ncbi:MAG TPA: type II secretion system minor pseudopilin GspK [Bradyrhizobium sp.]|nr:type II secretion system minor pseudopilin GspK [Bradyrhizobium sp.]
MTRFFASRASSQGGFVIVAVLWLLAALAALVTVFSIYLSNSARALAVTDEAVQAEGLVSAGVELTAYQLQLAGDEARPTHGSFHTRLSGVDLAVSFVSEAARIDLNAAPKELIAGLLTVLGASAEGAREYADRIVAWRTKVTGDGGGKEDALYRAAGRTYSPRQAPFAHINELALVLGPPPALVARALPYVTVFSGAAGVDALSATPEVIAALPGMTPLLLKQFLDGRGSLANDKAAIAAALGPAAASASAQKSRAYRIEVRLRFPNGRQMMSEIVIRLGKDKEENPYRVLSWQNDVPMLRRASTEF